MVVSISYDVVMRYAFVAPTRWALEVNTFLLVFMGVIPAGDVLRVGSLIRITFLYDRLRPAGEPAWMFFGPGQAFSFPGS
jgi:TRAP-type C4-dicarboxylate transport system permease small subunit